MFVAMNRFRVLPEAADAFEEVWRNRRSRLGQVPGFRSFHLLRGPLREDHVLYASHTIWEDEAAFAAWTRSEAFREAHRNAGDNRPLYMGPPEFEGFVAVLEE
ncbi:MAG: antibiotic biosynthesis monooxygenase [Rhodobacteraceae bacterium]|nr:antibiotic biosynthesis monooxygenase [Paracoccaceae bacterium]